MLRAMIDGSPAWFDAAFVAAGVVVACGFVLTFYVALRNRRALKAAGYDPLTAQVQMADRFLRSQEQRSPKPLEQRLAELDDLHARGVISAEEHADARAKALASP